MIRSSEWMQDQYAGNLEIMQSTVLIIGEYSLHGLLTSGMIKGSN